MISFIQGEIVEIAADSMVLQAGDIGYHIHIASSMAQALPGIGSRVKVHTYFQVREDAMNLFGFLNRDDLQLFQLLIAVNGIGPKGALSILSVMSADMLRMAILSQDAKSIAKAPGVGSKTAQRIILDLKDKVSASLDGEDMADAAGAGIDMREQGAGQEAVEALMALGYSGTEAMRAVKAAKPPEDADTEQILKLALKHL